MLGLLNIELHWIDQPFFLTGMKIPQPQTRIGMESARIHEPPAVGRKHRTHSGSLGIAAWIDLLSLSVIHSKLIFTDPRIPTRKI
jgi:hypothetical protein